MSLPSTVLAMLANSPIRPLEEHMSKVHLCVKSLIPFFEAVLARNWEAASKHHKNIRDLENEADALKKSLRLHLPKGLFMPVPRSDILELLSMQDKVANIVKDIAGLITGRQMQIPDSLTAQFTKLVRRSVDASEQANKAISELDDLLETGFGSNTTKLVAKMINKLDAIEHDTDEIQIKLRHDLFKIEQQLNPVDVIFLYKIIEWIGELANRAQRVGARLQILLAK